MFILFDENMQEIQYPEGLLPLDIFVSSLQKTVETETVPGVPGHILYGATHQQRTVELTMWLKSKDSTDYRLLRNEIYALFDTGRFMYVAEKNVPSRVLKILIDNAYTPSRLTSTVAEVTISARTLDEVYWQSRYTTLELHDSGYDAIAEKYGLVDNIDDEKVKYRFGPTLDTTNLTSDLFEQGNIHNSQGFDLDVATQYARTKGFHSVIKGGRYKLKLNESSGNASYVRIFHYNSDDSFIGNDAGMSSVNGNGTSEYTFTALGERLRLVVYPYGSNQVLATDIGTATQIGLSRYSTTSNFNVYNAGNVTVEPESMFLHIFIAGVTGDSITIKNNTTGETFTLNRKMSAKHIQVNGMVVTDGTVQVFRDTNKRFISLAPGDNDITVSGAVFTEIRFNFKYLYK